MLNISQRHFAHVTTVPLSWRMQHFVVIGRTDLKPEHGKFWSNFEFDGKFVSGTGAWTGNLAADLAGNPSVGWTDKLIWPWFGKYDTQPWASEIGVYDKYVDVSEIGKDQSVLFYIGSRGYIKPNMMCWLLFSSCKEYKSVYLYPNGYTVTDSILSLYSSNRRCP